MEENKRNNIKKFNHWLFDLDNTLYFATSGVFDQIYKKMGEFISKHEKVSLQEAKKLQKKYFIQNGTTLRGLMIHHNVDPKKFLDYVHDINFDIIKPNKDLNSSLKKINGKKIIFTNADLSYVEKVLDKLDLSETFDDIYDIERMNFKPKPNIETYRNLINFYSLKTKETIFFDDIPKNLLPAAELGITTVHVYNKYLDKELNCSSKKINYMTKNLQKWLEKWILKN